MGGGNTLALNTVDIYPGKVLGLLSFCYIAFSNIHIYVFLYSSYVSFLLFPKILNSLIHIYHNHMSLVCNGSTQTYL